ncbi:hypothetical protein PF005_g29152 [Phytophthora fragariae]|uniref:Uncharacterized protein n=1 Tax=Phytophthora fragariae TaxID=53985 RepID=A0A6A3F8A7_9STRA|nr:hypothetical protein PF003_g16181 [Phytophthora fragariae]KAE8940030.1 hypothetical protein PF009_g10140 [Phytophthora fragariae]KAE8990032.1 hypothetical protein PF011_g18524 [Phytophthora fragariae]KAE9072801.1 hypothetical protein PF007_g26048 [Phytophthora fragariae]KAE9088881.1 hypothetical protein PF010_g19211 [Phytophthora fragariae]
MASLRAKGPKNPVYQTVPVLNPKCISMGELYGEFNEATQEWHNGSAGSAHLVIVLINSQDLGGMSVPGRLE